MSTPTQHGYLIIADISGYTSFVANTELEHSQEILSELLGSLVGRFQPTMTISKLEGDAVFAFIPEEMFVRSETWKPALRDYMISPGKSYRRC